MTEFMILTMPDDQVADSRLYVAALAGRPLPRHLRIDLDALPIRRVVSNPVDIEGEA
jgi:hypothetical protein